MDIFSWIESHSVILGIASALLAGSLWYRKFLMQKRAEAFFGFYTRLLLQIKSLYKWLDEKHLLEVKNIKRGNIYALAYSHNVLDTVCTGFYNIEEKEKDQFKVLEELANQLKGTLLQTECNVYPKRLNKKSWYHNQHVLLEFCFFVTEKGRRGVIDEPFKAGENAVTSDESIPDDSNKEPLNPVGSDEEPSNPEVYYHIKKCKELITSMKMLQKHIEKTHY